MNVDARRASYPVARTPEIIWGSLGTVLLFVGLVAVLVMPAALHLLPGCVFKAATGVPCVACGGTRAAVALAHGQPLHALGWNPLAAAALLGLALYVPYAWFVVSGAMRPLRTGWLSPPMPVWLRWVIITALLANWSYLIAVGR